MEGLAMAGAGAPLAGPDDLVQCTHVGLRRIPRIARIARDVTERADIGRRASAVLPTLRARHERLRDPPALGHFCQVRFLCRLARSFLRRLCLLILAFRRFLSEPIQRLSIQSSPALPCNSVLLTQTFSSGARFQ